VLGLVANLYDDLEEKLYIEQFENFEKKKQEHLVYKLRRSLYGLKQAPQN
jgi:Reverse transcriptase (RNA-dependent DNA polymerase)